MVVPAMWETARCCTISHAGWHLSREPLKVQVGTGNLQIGDLRWFKKSAGKIDAGYAVDIFIVQGI